MIFGIVQSSMFCIPITLNNPLKPCFSNKYLITTQTRPNISLKKKRFLTDFERLLVHKIKYLSLFVQF